MRPMTALTLTPALVAVLALGACSSDDDDTPSASGTSALAPGEQPEAPISTTSGGDTTAIAGLWDATREITVTDGDQTTTGDDIAYVQISTDGLWTYHDYAQDVTGDENCYRTVGPRTLTPEGGDDYSLSGEEDAWTLSVSGDVLTTRLGAEGEVMSWPRTGAEIDLAGFNECTVAPGADPVPGDRDTGGV